MTSRRRLAVAWTRPVAPSVVLVTGVSRFLGGNLAARLAADPSIERVLGVDTVPPARDLRRRMGRVEFVRADIRNPLIAKVVARAEVDTVVHAALSPDPSGARRRGDQGDERPRHDAAARRVPEGAVGAAGGARVDHRRVRREPAGPGAVRRDDDAERPARPAGTPATPRRSRATCAASPGAAPTSRSPCCGSPAWSGRGSTRCSPATSRCRSCPPSSATTRGCSSCTRKTPSPCSNAPSAHDLPGVVNVAADGVLLLSQAIRRAGRVPLPVPQPAVGTVGRVLAAARVAAFSPEQLRLLDFGRVVDTTRLRDRVRLHPALDHRRRPSTTSCAAARSARCSGASGSRRPERLVDRGVHAAARLLAGLGGRP